MTFLSWSVPRCAYCNSGTKPFYLSLERLEPQDEIPVHSPESQLAQVTQESIAQQSETSKRKRTKKKENLTKKDEFTSQKGNSFCFPFLGQGPKLWPQELTL